MSQAAEGGAGTVLKISTDTTTNNYQTIPDVEMISAIGLSGNPVDVTTLDSPGGWREFKSFTKQGNKITFGFNYIPTNTAQKVPITALTDATGNVRACRIDIGGLTTKSWAGQACVESVSIDVQTADRLAGSITLQMTGVWTHP